jgi:hypothetical protein
MGFPSLRVLACLAVLSPLGLAACSGDDGAAPVTGAGGVAPVTGAGGMAPGTCDAARFQDRIGGPLLSSSEPAPAKGPFLRVSDLPHPQRILPPGSVVTQDHRPDRMNVFLDAAGRVTAITCG